MLLESSEVRRVLKVVKAAFPNYRKWEYNNEVNHEHSGFAVWGELAVESCNRHGPRTYFVTFNIFEGKWKGDLSIGLPMYYWSNADFGDADLVDTVRCDSVEEVIENLKAEILEMCNLLRSADETN